MVYIRVRVGILLKGLWESCAGAPRLFPELSSSGTGQPGWAFVFHSSDSPVPGTRRQADRGASQHLPPASGHWKQHTARLPVPRQTGNAKEDQMQGLPRRTAEPLLRRQGRVAKHLPPTSPDRQPSSRIHACPKTPNNQCLQCCRAPYLENDARQSPHQTTLSANHSGIFGTDEFLHPTACVAPEPPVGVEGRAESIDHSSEEGMTPPPTTAHRLLGCSSMRTID